MDTEYSRYFTPRDEELSDILARAGLKRNFARVLVYLFKGTELTSRDIERGTDLRQPEVSIAINYLLKQGWARVTNLLTENKGRPVKLYRLGADIDHILNGIETEKKEEFREQIDLIEQARKMIKEQGTG